MARETIWFAPLIEFLVGITLKIQVKENLRTLMHAWMMDSDREQMWHVFMTMVSCYLLFVVFVIHVVVVVMMVMLVVVVMHSRFTLFTLTVWHVILN